MIVIPTEKQYKIIVTFATLSNIRTWNNNGFKNLKKTKLNEYIPEISFFYHVDINNDVAVKFEEFLECLIKTGSQLV